MPDRSARSAFDPKRKSGRLIGIHKIPLNVVCDKVRGLLPKSRGPFAHGVKLKNPVSPSKHVQRTSRSEMGARQ